MKIGRLIRKALAVAVLLLVFGLVRAPVEEALTRRLIAEKVLDQAQTGNLAGLVSQSTFLAVLGGLRPLVAIYTTLHAFDAWSYRDWDTVERDYRIIVALMPEDVDSWKAGAWHLAYNAAASSYLDESLPEATRIRLMREWVRKGIAFLEAGLGRHPRSSALHKQLADIYREKLEEPCLAARHYRLAMEGDAPQSYIRRFYGYFLARCPGSEREAYDYLMALYAEGPSQRLPTLIQRIKELEGKLAVPETARIPDPDPDVLIRQRFPEARLP